MEQLDNPTLTSSFHTLTAFAEASVGDRQRTEEHDRRLLAVAERSPDGATAGIALSQLSYDAARTGQFQRGIAQGLEAVAKLESGDKPKASAVGWINLGANYYLAGNGRQALEAFSRAIAIGERTGGARVQAMGSAFMGFVLSVCMGEIDSGLASCRRAVHIASDPFCAFYSHPLARASSRQRGVAPGRRGPCGPRRLVPRVDSGARGLRGS